MQYDSIRPNKASIHAAYWLLLACNIRSVWVAFRCSVILYVIYERLKTVNNDPPHPPRPPPPSPSCGKCANRLNLGHQRTCSWSHGAQLQLSPGKGTTSLFVSKLQWCNVTRIVQTVCACLLIVHDCYWRVIFGPFG